MQTPADAVEISQAKQKEKKKPKVKARTNLSGAPTNFSPMELEDDGWRYTGVNLGLLHPSRHRRIPGLHKKPGGYSVRRTWVSLWLEPGLTR